MSSSLPKYPDCASTNVVKNGTIYNGKQNHKCNDCGRQFVKDPQNKIIDDATKALMDKLLLEKLPLAGIARVVEVSEPWLQQYVNAKYESVRRHANLKAKKKAD
ncbi:MAG: hypothetical protein ACFB4I_16285 [Cyanophyceae cyanobacterium]